MNNFKDLANSYWNASAAISKLGEEQKKAQLLETKIPPKGALNHREKVAHIHDLEFYDLAYNCIGLNVSNLLGERKFTFEQAIRQLGREIVAVSNSQSGGIGFLNFDADMAKYIEDESVEELSEVFREFFMDLNTVSRKGCEKPYVTFNFGLDCSFSGKKCTQGILNACRQGDRFNRPFIFPNLVFKLKRDVNFTPGSPNYELYQLALETSAQRMIPSYFNCDSSYNQSVSPSEIGIMGCRTRVVDNLWGKAGGIRRGNIASSTVNLVQIALKSKGDKDRFFMNLAQIMDESRDTLISRLGTLVRDGDFSYVFEKGLYQGAENGSAEAMLRNGTLAVGFIGLWDALSVLHKQEWDSIDALRPFYEEALEVVKFMREKTDAYSKAFKLNFSLLATAAEGLCGQCAEYDWKIFKHPVCEKGFYTNSFHIPVNIPCDFTEKIELEGRFHSLCNGGAITYVELEEMPGENSEAIEDIVKVALESDCNYFGVNFPLDTCLQCGYAGRIATACPNCSSEAIKRLRRVSGYLAETDKFTRGKSLELAQRIPHFAN